MPKRVNRRKIHETIENKGQNQFQPFAGEFQNCANSGALAQLKARWRNLRGAVQREIPLTNFFGRVIIRP
jgi:hypothetical protein